MTRQIVSTGIACDLCSLRRGLLVRRLVKLVALLVTTCLVGVPLSHAQDFPAKQIKFVVPYPPGGSGDLLGRLYAEYLAKALDASVVVENKPGAATNIALEQLSRTEPDGYTLMLGTGQTMINVVFGPKPTIDPFTGVASLALIAEMPFIISAGVDTGINSARDIVTKGRGGQVTIGHAQFEPQIKLLSAAIGTPLDSIPFQGGAASAMAAIGGHTQLVGSYVPVVVSQLKAGKLRAVGVASKARVSALPDVPTFAEQGYPKFVTTLSYSLLAPKGLPDAISRKLTAASLAAVNNPGFIARLKTDGGEPLPGNAEDAVAVLRNDLSIWTAVQKGN